jgi:2-keto-4-pentenoate hydratase/2-oxohepta-3-ene-1,7-dioic acid hydratase in catechol pathway
MKLASVECGTGPTVAALDDGGELVDLREVDNRLPSEMRALLELGPDALADIVPRLAKTTRRLDPGLVRFLPVVPQPQAIWCAALNYRPHIEEGAWETPTRPPLFLRIPASLCGHEEPIVKPFVSDRLDYEGELAVIIGTHARHVPESSAYDVVAGYSCFNDGSVRDWQRHTNQITNGKNFASTGGFGPFLTTKDEVPASIICDLLPGDVIATGTPGGVGGRQDPPRFLLDGDIVEVEVAGVGKLRNPVVAEDRPAAFMSVARRITV